MNPGVFLLNRIKANLPVAVGQEKLQGGTFDNSTLYFSGLRRDHPPAVLLNLLMGCLNSSLNANMHAFDKIKVNWLIGLHGTKYSNLALQMCP